MLQIGNWLRQVKFFENWSTLAFFFSTLGKLTTELYVTKIQKTIVGYQYFVIIYQ